MGQYAIITGQGRSGTNWLLDMLDASPLTHCRNEPNVIPGSPFARLPERWKAGAGQPEMEFLWDEIAHATATRMGERDHRLENPKRYVHRLSQRTGLAYLPARPKARKVLAMPFPRFRQGEWSMPWWVGSQQKLSEAYGVLKLNQSAQVVCWVLEHCLEVPVLHIVRHPGGRLHSWLNRFLWGREITQILTRNRERLHQIVEFDPVWAKVLDNIDIDAMNLVESETWFWRYVTEKIHRVGQDLPHYKRLIYEELAQDPMTSARQVYDFCGLPWSDDVEKIIHRNLGRSVWGPLSGSPQKVSETWKTRLDVADIATVERVLAGSLMQDWWP